MIMSYNIHEHILIDVRRAFGGWTAMHIMRGWKVKYKDLNVLLIGDRVVIESVFNFERLGSGESWQLAGELDICSVAESEADVNKVFYGTLEALGEAWSQLPEHCYTTLQYPF